MPDDPILPNQTLDKELLALYAEKGKLPDMTHLERRRRRRVTRVLTGLIILFAILATASWLGFFLFNPMGGGAEGRVRIEGPENVVSGVPHTLVITYENSDTEPLAFASMRLRVPRGLNIIESEPASTAEGRFEWDFGTLPPKSENTIRLKVVPYGVEDERLDLIAILNYKPANFNAEFQTSYTHGEIIRSTGIRITLAGPTQGNPGQTLAFKATIENISAETFEQVRVALDAPEAFSLIRSVPSAENQIWRVDALRPGEIKELDFSGTFLSNADGIQTLELITATGPEDQSFIFARAEHQLEVQNAALEITIIVNESPYLQWVRTNQTLSFRLNITNRQDEPIENATARLILSGGLFNFEDADADNGTINAETVSFPAEGAFSLEKNEGKEFTVRIPVGGAETRTLSPFLEAYAEIRYGDTSVKTAPLKIMVVSDLSLAAQAFYFDANGTPLGKGPLPPKVGEETRFAIRLMLANTLHDLSRVVVSATLPSGVRWVGSGETQAGAITFNEAAREVRWEIENMPVSVPRLTAQFEIAATPLENDRGKLIPLLGIARVEALDTISQVTFSADAPSLSSSLENDPHGRGQGVVE